MPKVGWVRIGCGAITGTACLLFLWIDSGILARGAARWATSDLDRWSYAAMAWSIPWLIAILPLFITLAWWLKHRLWAVSGAVLYVVFLGYNAVGAGGAIAMIRSDTVSARKFDASRDRDRTKDRQQLVEQRDAIKPIPRPADTVAAALGIERTKPLWQNSESCKAPDGRAEQRFCQGFKALEGELASSLALAKLEAKIAALDSKTAVAGWVAEVVDPESETWAQATGIPVETLQKLLPLRNPIALMLGAMVLGGMTALFLGFNHRTIVLGSHDGLASAALGGRSDPAPALAAAHSMAINFVTEWFAEHSRPAQGSLAEDTWYAHYSQACAGSGATPVSIETFRDVAQKHGALVRFVDGKHWYSRMLPLVKGAA
jgi:hypothetical protein